MMLVLFQLPLVCSAAALLPASFGENFHVGKKSHVNCDSGIHKGSLLNCAELSIAKPMFCYDEDKGLCQICDEFYGSKFIFGKKKCFVKNRKPFTFNYIFGGRKKKGYYLLLKKNHQLMCLYTENQVKFIFRNSKARFPKAGKCVGILMLSNVDQINCPRKAIYPLLTKNGPVGMKTKLYFTRRGTIEIYNLDDRKRPYPSLKNSRVACDGYQIWFIPSSSSSVILAQIPANGHGEYKYVGFDGSAMRAVYTEQEAVSLYISERAKTNTMKGRE